jgi:hypothetical protein
MSLEQIIGLALVILTAILILVFGLLWPRLKRFSLRSIPALNQLRKSVGLTIEDGKRLHVSLGNASILGAGNAASLAGLSMIERLAMLSMVSDRPTIVTSGDGSLMILSQDVLRYLYRKGNILTQYDPLHGQLTGISPFSYAVGAMPVIANEDVLTSVLIGRFGPEVAFLNDVAYQNKVYSLAASDDLTAQAVMFASAQDVLIGEELYALPAYLQRGSFQRASLLSQDILRWILVAVLLGGVILAIIRQLFGLTIL